MFSSPIQDDRMNMTKNLKMTKNSHRRTLTLEHDQKYNKCYDNDEP